MNISWFSADLKGELNTSIHRIFVPSTMMSRAGYPCYVTHIAEILSGKPSPETQNALHESSVIVLERLLMKESHEFIKDMRFKGKKVFVTFDDNYGLMPAGAGKSYETWRGGKSAVGGRGAILNEFRGGLSLCDGFMVPSKVLAEDFRAYNPNPQFVPNYLLGDFWDKLPGKDPDNFVIGWGGSSGHYESWGGSSLISALESLCAKYPRLYLHLQTRDPRILKILDSAKVRYRAYDWVRFEEWPKIVASFNLYAMPLSGAYDLRRSALKTTESAMAGVPWIATKAPPYLESKGGILVDDTKKKHSENWFRAIDSLIKDKALYQRLSEEGRAWAKEFNAGAVRTYEKAFGL